jgi:YcaO cyclodehydratase, ATP-ad Mg2+-binding
MLYEVSYVSEDTTQLDFTHRLIEKIENRTLTRFVRTGTQPVTHSYHTRPLQRFDEPRILHEHISFENLSTFSSYLKNTPYTHSLSYTFLEALHAWRTNPSHLINARKTGINQALSQLEVGKTERILEEAFSRLRILSLPGQPVVVNDAYSVIHKRTVGVLSQSMSHLHTDRVKSRLSEPLLAAANACTIGVGTSLQGATLDALLRTRAHELTTLSEMSGHAVGSFHLAQIAGIYPTLTELFRQIERYRFQLHLTYLSGHSGIHTVLATLVDTTSTEPPLCCAAASHYSFVHAVEIAITRAFLVRAQALPDAHTLNTVSSAQQYATLERLLGHTAMMPPTDIHATPTHALAALLAEYTHEGADVARVQIPTNHNYAVVVVASDTFLEDSLFARQFGVPARCMSFVQ